MNYKFRGRFTFISVAVVIVSLLLSVALYYRTVIVGEEVVANTTVSSIREVTVPGKRGMILDSNGTPLAYDEVSYNVQFLKDPSRVYSSDTAHYTQVLIRVTDVLKAHDCKIIDSFNIVKGENGSFKFDFGDISISAEQTRIKNWISNMAITGNVTDPEQIYYELRTRYRIPEDYNYEEARTLLSIWQEVQLTSYSSYLPVDISTGVDFSTVEDIAVAMNELDGIQIEESWKRVYPQNSLGAHLIGYTGRISDGETLEEYKEKGYDEESLIGKTGVEYSMEEYLTGESADKRGVKTLRVNSAGVALEELSSTEAHDGNNVYLNVDIEFQNVVMDALKNNIERVSQEQWSEYRLRLMDEKKAEELTGILGNRQPDFCNSGGAIVVDIDSLAVKAIASYPSYDLNDFVGGISTEKLDELTNSESTPLFDRAIQSKATPGSIFKLLTAVAGLMENQITLDETIDDEGPYTKYITNGSTAPACWTPNYHAHQRQDVIKAIKNSCNYYFYVVSDRLKIDTLCKWADNFGLTSKTGIELPYEVTGFVGNQKVLYDSEKGVSEQVTSMPKLVYNAIRRRLVEYGVERSMEYSQESLNTAAEKIVALAGLGTNRLGDQIRKVLSNELDIPENYTSSKNWDDEINSMLLELIWDGTDTVTTGIGTNITQLTPIAVVRYLATILNGGKLMVPHVVSRIASQEGKLIKEIAPEVIADLNIKEEYIDAIKEGMKEVTLTTDGGGTAAKVFKDFNYLGQFGGKSGTAPVSNLDLEDNGWFIAFAPYDKPEIAIVVYLPHGASGSNAAFALRDILQYYFDKKNTVIDNVENIYPGGVLLP